MCAKRQKVYNDDFEPIRILVENNVISHKEISDFANIDYPLFSFKYLRPNSIKNCGKGAFFFEFLIRLKELSEKSWSEIRQSRRHDYGMEPLPRSCFKPDTKCIGDIITDDVDKLHVFRADRTGHSFAGLQIGRIFYIIFIETEFGDIYNHGKKK